MSIKVTNISASTIIEVSINQWGSDGDTKPKSLGPGESDSWNRTDPRGFVMFLEAPGNHHHAYYVLANDIITIDFPVNGTFKVLANGKQIHHCERG